MPLEAWKYYRKLPKPLVIVRALTLRITHPLNLYATTEMTILFDSGIRTGADVFKAIALGAHAVMVGRLYVWGMSHEGDSGCRHVIKSLLAVSTFSPCKRRRLHADIFVRRRTLTS